MKESLYRRIAVALGSINYGVCSDTEAMNDLVNLLVEILDMMDSSKIIVVDRVDYMGMEDDNNETL